MRSSIGVGLVASLTRGRQHAKLLHEPQRVIVSGMAGDFPVLDLEDLTGVQRHLPTNGWKVTGGAIHDPGMGARRIASTTA